MPQSLVKILVHVVFSTKDRVGLIAPSFEEMLYGYISGVITNNDARLIVGSGTSNHIHLLISLGRIAIAELIGDIKRSSSLWVKSHGKEFSKILLAAWIWCILYWSVAGAGCVSVHSRSKRASWPDWPNV